jgi:helix-turn-helix protein
MFEIGNSLREARLRQSFDLNEVERRTKIRAKYLRALEEERFELLPAQTYVKGFLRTYADVLGLDGQLYVDEYNSRFVVGDDESGLRPRRSAARQQHRRLESNVVLIVLASIAVVTALVIGAWKSGGGASPEPRYQRPAQQAAGVAAKVPKVGVLLVIRAKRGNSLLEIHAKGANGPLRYQGTLLKGGTPLKVWARRLWINVGTPENLDVTLNGRHASFGGTGQPRVLLIDRHGVHPASAA